MKSCTSKLPRRSICLWYYIHLASIYFYQAAKLMNNASSFQTLLSAVCTAVVKTALLSKSSEATLSCRLCFYSPFRRVAASADMDAWSCGTAAKVPTSPRHLDCASAPSGLSHHAFSLLGGLCELHRLHQLGMNRRSQHHRQSIQTISRAE